MAMYNWTDPKDGSNVLGKPVPLENAAFLNIETCHTIHPKELPVGESCHVTVRSSGQTGTYIVTRVE